MFVRNKMTTNPFTITTEQTIPEAIELMNKYNIKRLPVLQNGKLVGVVSREDIDKSSPSKATSFSAGEITYLLSKTKIGKIMTKNPITISSGALLEEAALLMRNHSVGFLPVVDDGKLVGIITQSDILDSFIELLGFREHGTRLTVEVDDAPGIIANLTAIIGKYGANITNIAVYRGSMGKSDIVIGINTLNTEEMEKSIEAQGYKIIYKLQNNTKNV